MSIGRKVNSILITIHDRFMAKKSILAITLCGFILLLLILILRSFIYAKRTLLDVALFAKNNKKVEDFLPYIRPCVTEKQELTDEERHLLNYRLLGIKCEK